jgi:hypothetical protein
MLDSLWLGLRQMAMQPQEDRVGVSYQGNLYVTQVQTSKRSQYVVKMQSLERSNWFHYNQGLQSSDILTEWRDRGVESQANFLLYRLAPQCACQQST